MKLSIKNILFYIVMLLPLLVAACGGDDTGGSSSVDQSNINANTKEEIAETYRTRYELPHMLDGNNYLEVVHSTSDYGVNFIIEWDCSRRAQRWVAYEWNSTNYGGSSSRSNSFTPDPDIPATYRSELSDYPGAGYQRGHMCASADRKCSDEANAQTFYLSNMHPQIQYFNGYGTGWTGIWCTMENQMRSWCKTVVKTGGVMWVCKGGTIYGDGSVNINGTTTTGVLANNPETGASNANMRIPVPKYFFMTAVTRTSNGQYKGMAFWVEHKHDVSTNWKNYMISIDELEKRTGIDFFCNLPDKVENTVEANLDTSAWN